VGFTLLDEMEIDYICIHEVDKHTCEVHNKFSKEQPTSTSLKEIMESEIQELVFGYHGA
jgi:hypothetical protein